MTKEINNEVYNVPGFISEVMKHTESVAFNPNLPLSFAGALAALAHLSGHGYIDQRGGSTNLMVFALAPSGVGKDKAREVNRDLAALSGKAVTVRENFASGEGIEDTLLQMPVTMYQVDEIHTLMAKLARGDQSALKMSQMLLELYSQSTSNHVMRDKARGMFGGLGDVIYSPHLTVYGTGTMRFYEAINRSLLEDGMMGRSLIIEGDKLGDDNFSCHTGKVPPAVEALLKVLNRKETEATKEYGYEPMVVPETEEATEALKRKILALTDLARKCEAEGEATPMALWARAKDKVCKLALLFAISRNPESPCIVADDVERAYLIVEHATEVLLARAQEYVHDNAFHADCQKVLRLIERKLQANSGGVPHRLVVQGAHMKPSALNQVLHMLVDTDQICVCEGPQGGNIYKLAA